MAEASATGRKTVVPRPPPAWDRIMVTSGKAIAQASSRLRELGLGQAGLFGGQDAGVARRRSRRWRRRAPPRGRRPCGAAPHIIAGAPGVQRRGRAAGQVVDQLAARLLGERRALRLHLALGEGVGERLEAHGPQRRLGRRAALVRVVVAGGAVGRVDRRPGCGRPLFGVWASACALPIQEAAAATTAVAAARTQRFILMLPMSPFDPP